MTASILVQYADGADSGAADIILQQLQTDSISSRVSIKKRRTTSIDWTQWDGVVLVGGENANPLRKKLNEAIWVSVEESGSRIQTVNPTNFAEADFGGVVASAAAGITAHETRLAAGRWAQNVTDTFLDSVQGDVGEELNRETASEQFAEDIQDVQEGAQGFIDSLDAGLDEAFKDVSRAAKALLLLIVAVFLLQAFGGE